MPQLLAILVSIALKTRKQTSVREVTTVPLLNKRLSALQAPGVLEALALLMNAIHSLRALLVPNATFSGVASSS